MYWRQPTLTLDRSDGIAEKEILKIERGCSSIFCTSTSSLHRNVHTSSLDSSYCFPNHFLTIHSPGTAIQSCVFSTGVNAAVCTAQLITAWDESGFYKAPWTLKAQRESLLKARALLHSQRITVLSDFTLCWYNWSLEECPRLQCGLVLVWKSGELVWCWIWTFCIRFQKLRLHTLECEMFIATHASCSLLILHWIMDF